MKSIGYLTKHLKIFRVLAMGHSQLAELIGVLPPEVFIYAIAAKRFDLGDDLSEPMQRAIDNTIQTAAGRILARL